MEPGQGHRKRCKRWDTLWSVHYLTFSCFKRQPFLTSERARGWLLDSLQEARVKHPFNLWAYVIMPEHVHLLIRPHEGVKISPLLKALKQPVAQKVVRWVQENAPHFLPNMLDLQPNGDSAYRFWQRGGGYDRNTRSPQETREKLRYIHLNPVRRKLVSRPEEYPWSSARAWILGVDEPVPIDRHSLSSIEGRVR